jgi:hypothetical protein
MSAKTTTSGSAGPENWTETRIENAIPAPGAMCVIDWKRVWASQSSARRRWSKVPGAGDDWAFFGLPPGR